MGFSFIAKYMSSIFGFFYLIVFCLDLERARNNLLFSEIILAKIPLWPLLKFIIH